MYHLIWKMLSTIKNGYSANKKSILFPYKSFCKQILQVLYKEGYISGFRVLPGGLKKLEVFLKYSNGKPAVSRIVAISKPSKRVFIPLLGLWKQNSSLHTLIISTSTGVLSDKDCRKRFLGGELICLIQ